MRLTLRTLLAYRDRVLNPTELEDMHGRVQQSAMASNLVKRLESLSQRTNILAPPIEGKGLGGDANSIAEYLDDTLKGDKVPELERICLESDVQLAELAQCHTLLSAALSTAVDVPAALRQRVVALSDEANRTQALARRQHDARGAIETAAAHAESDGKSKDGRLRFRTDDSHTASSAEVAATPEIANGKSTKHKERELVPAQAVTAPMMASGGDSIRPSGLDLEGSHLAHEVPEYLRGRSRDGWLGPVAIGGLVCLLCLLVWQSIGSFNSVLDMFTQTPSNEPTANGESASITRPTPNAEPGNERANANAKPVADANATRTTAGDAASKTASGLIAGETDARANDSTKNSTGQSALPSADVSAPTNSLANEPNIPTVPGNAINDAAQVALWSPADAKAMQAVVLIQTAAQSMHRLQPSEPITSGSQLFIPSANRPKFALIGGPQWQVCGTTHALVTKPDTDANAIPQIDLRLGRSVVTDTSSGNALSLATPAGGAQLTLGAGASVAIELSYKPQSHGSVIDPAVYVPTLSLFAIEGEMSLQLNNQSVVVAPGNRVAIVSGQASSPEATEAPLWIDSTFDRPVDLQAAADLSKELGNNVAVGETLQKLATHRRPEMRALAAQTLSLLGSWDWVTQPKSSLSEVRDRSFWAALLDRTRQILAAHPENVNALAASLQQIDQASAQWRLMMWLGMDAGQLQADGGKKILASLESDALIERILAIQQLQRATGKDLGYLPAEPSRTIVGQWSREFSTAKLPLLPAPKS